MSRQLEVRLKELKAEYATGRRELAELETKEKALKQTLERLSQAIREIEELLKRPGSKF